MLCMVPDKVYLQMAASNVGFRKFDVWTINAGKQTIQAVQNRP